MADNQTLRGVILGVRAFAESSLRNRFHFPALRPIDRVEQSHGAPRDWHVGVRVILGFQAALYFA
jgi:hypothetical protein